MWPTTEKNSILIRKDDIPKKISKSQSSEGGQSSQGTEKKEIIFDYDSDANGN